MKRYESFEDLNRVIENDKIRSDKTTKQYGNSSYLIRLLIEEACPGFSYTVLTQVSNDVIVKGRSENAKKKNNLESWLGKPKNVNGRPLSASNVAFIEKRLKEIKEMRLPRGQGAQACWLANFALKQDLGKIFSDPRAQELPLYYNIPWNKLPSWE